MPLPLPGCSSEALRCQCPNLGVDMKRREFLGVVGGVAAWPIAVRAQERVRRIGILIGYSEDDPETKSRLTAFRAGLAKRGWFEGRNVTIDYRFTAATESRVSV